MVNQVINYLDKFIFVVDISEDTIIDICGLFLKSEFTIHLAKVQLDPLKACLLSTIIEKISETDSIFCVK